LKDFRNFKFSSNITSSPIECQGVSLSSLTRSQTRILDKILILGNKHTYVFPNQTTLGKSAGVGLRQSHRIVKWLCENGLLEKLTRPNLTCVYRAPKFLLDPKIRQQYSDKFEAFRWLPFILLFCPLFNLNVVGTILDNRFIYKPLSNPIVNNINKLTDSKRRVGVYSNEARTKIILELTRDLNLNKLGQIKLSPYPFECLQYCQEKFRSIKNPRDAFAFFLTLCKNWCDLNDVRPDWKAMYDLAMKFKLDLAGNVYGNGEVFKQNSYYGAGEYQQGSHQQEGRKSYSSNKPTGKATDYSHVNFSFPPMTREEYNDPILSKEYNDAISKHNNLRKLAKAQERGDQESVSAHTFYDNPDYSSRAFLASARYTAGLLTKEQRLSLIEQLKDHPQGPELIAALLSIDKPPVESPPIAVRSLADILSGMNKSPI